MSRRGYSVAFDSPSTTQESSQPAQRQRTNMVLTTAKSGSYSNRGPPVVGVVLGRSKVGGKVKASKAFKAKVKAIIEREAEKKQKDSWISQTGFGPGTSCLPISLTPNASTLTISQGSGVDQRLGNKVKIHKAMFRGYFSPAVYDALVNPAPQPMFVKMYFLTDKTAPTSATNPSAGGTGFYRQGATTSDMNGAQMDPVKEINTERFTVYGTRIFKVGWETFASGSGQAPTKGLYANNDFSMGPRFEIDVTKWMPKHIVWNDTSVTPTSRLLYCVLEATGVVDANAGPATTTNVCGAIHLTYTDE